MASLGLTSQAGHRRPSMRSQSGTGRSPACLPGGEDGDGTRSRGQPTALRAIRTAFTYSLKGVGVRRSVSPMRVADLRAVHETPPDLHGQTPFIDRTGHWVGLVALRTEVAEERPHGLSRSSTPHTADGTRRVGFDNAHPVRARRGSGARRRRESDHGHRTRTIRPRECGDTTTPPGDYRKEAAAVPQARGVSP